MADVTQEAGLSLGIVNLHFQSKDKLLVETLRFISDDYFNGWRKHVIDAHETAVDRMSALIEHDFSRRVCNPNYLALWFAFWGESKSRPTYRRICSVHDRECKLMLDDICQSLIEVENRTDLDADVISTTYQSLVDGLWLDRLIIPEELTLEKAKLVCRAYFLNLFPKQFTERFAPGSPTQ